MEYATLIIIIGAAIVISAVARWKWSGPRAAEPWAREIDDALDAPEAVPLCLHCLAPQEHDGWFCPECGATVGLYCNYMPFVSLFSQGEVLRAGVANSLPATPLRVAGYVLLAFSSYAIFAPFYWIALFRGLGRTEQPADDGVATDPAP